VAGWRHGSGATCDRQDVKYNDAGGYLVVVTIALLVLLVGGWRTGRNLLGHIWSRVGFMKWIFALIAIAVVVGITREYPGR
jgi:hypothetical protein